MQYGGFVKGFSMPLLPNRDTLPVNSLTNYLLPTHSGETISAETNRALGFLEERERLIIERTFGINGQPEMTLEEIGEGLELSRERVRQIREKAIRKLRTMGINNL